MDSEIQIGVSEIPIIHIVEIIEVTRSHSPSFTFREPTYQELLKARFMDKSEFIEWVESLFEEKHV